jgi:nicotinate-nucleotide adenylyltransferase
VKLGLLGGTFNPPHIAHLVCASEALDQLGLHRVELLPVHTPPHKEAEADPGVDCRLELCRLAVAEDDRLGVSAAEAEIPGRSYTVDTLRRLHARRPEDELTFIVGGDMAQSLAAWRDAEGILELAEIGVAGRDGVDRDAILDRLSGLRGVPDRIRFFDMPRIDISSSEIRRRAAGGRSIRHLVPDPVAAAIERARLYR